MQERPANTLPSSALIATLLAALLSFALFHRLGATPLFEDPNEGQYAEVAREMVESGEWLSPQLDYVLFLNKPPLQYWLIAASYRLFGVDEAAARLPGVLTAALAVLLLFLLGRRLFGGGAGLAAASIYAAMPSTIIEARFVRPDGLLVTATIGAVYAFLVALDAAPARRTRALVGLQIALAAGLMGKGALGLLLPGIPIAAALLAAASEERRRGDDGRPPITAFLADLARPRSWLVFVALIVPWHLLMAARHQGFAWDYIVNQHFLFFFDKKEPRDSIPIPLGEFWGITLARTFPWTLLLPLALLHPVLQRGALGGRRRGVLLTAAWAAGILLFFSLAVSRLEHYALPALPALALLLATFLGGAPSPRWRHATAIALSVTAGAALVGVFAAPAALASIDWLSAVPELRAVARLFFAGLAATTAAAALLGRRNSAAIAPVVAAGMLLLTPLVNRGLAVVGRFNSSAPVAAALRAQPDIESAHIVFAAPTEYQSVAGLCFYLHRRVDLLAPAGFVAPDYLEPYVDTLFLDRAELAALWPTGPAYFVTDPLDPDRPPEDMVPAPRRLVAAVANRSIYSNQPAEGGPGDGTHDR